MSSSPQSNEPEEAQMNTVPYDTAEEGWDRYEEEGEDYSPPGRPRRQFFNRWTAVLLALILGAVGFYVGVRVEKSQLSNSSSTSAGSAASRLAALGGAGGAAGARAGAGGTAGTGAAGAGSAGRAGAAGGGGGAAGAGGLRTLFGGGAGGSSSFGTVSSIDGNTLYINETSGNMVKVTLSSATKVTKNVTVGKNAVRPGDAVVVAGAKGSNGTISATSLSDTGASPFAAAGGSGSGGSGATNSTSGSSAVSSLFGGG
jgi:hypothetical protein